MMGSVISLLLQDEGVVIAVVIAAIFILSAIIKEIISVQNRLSRYRQNTQAALATTDVMLAKRHDLIPNLVATASQYAKHESETLVKLAAQRSPNGIDYADIKARIDSDTEVTEVVRELLLRIEDYPELKASENFMHLQRTLNEVEEQLSAARRAFIGSVLQYNTTLESFPASIVGRTLGYRSYPTYSIEAQQRLNPEVGHLFER